MTEIITQSQAAELIGVTARRLRQIAQADDGPPQDANGQYPAREFGEWMKRRHLSGLTVGEDGKVYDLEAERARLAKEQADKTAMENEEKRGRLIDAEKAAGWWVQIITNAKTKILAIPTKAAPLVLGCKSLAQAKDVLEKLIHESLTELSATNPVTVAGGEGAASVETAAAPDSEPVGRSRKKAKSRK